MTITHEEIARIAADMRTADQSSGMRWVRWRCAGLDCSHEFDSRSMDFPVCTWCGSETGRVLSIRIGYYGVEILPPKV